MDFLSRTDKSYRKLGYKRSIYWAPIIVRVNCKSGLYYEARAVIENSQNLCRHVLTTELRSKYKPIIMWNLIFIPALQFQHQWGSSFNKQETSQGTYFKVTWTLFFSLLWKMQTLNIMHTKYFHHTQENFDTLVMFRHSWPKWLPIICIVYYARYICLADKELIFWQQL